MEAQSFKISGQINLNESVGPQLINVLKFKNKIKNKMQKPLYSWRMSYLDATNTMSQITSIPTISNAICSCVLFV